MGDEKRARRFRIRGKVQGVGYRFFAMTCAEALGLGGWVKNLDDGSVEAHAEGTQEKIDEFAFDLSRGARFARVSEIATEDVPVEDHESFAIRR
ncbi:MAG: acylphosphatase [Acidobacteriota bacterium]|nr:acylphosphatase [Acidobacteriota bacterium]